MGYTKAQIIAIAQENVRRGSELDTIAEKRFNLILDQLYESYSWVFLSKDPAQDITLTAGSSTFQVPSDFLSIISLRLVDTLSNPSNPPHIPLVPKSWGSFNEILVPSQEADKPEYYSLNIGYSDSLNPVAVGYVWPIPRLSWTLKMAYYYKPVFDIADASEPNFPDSLTLVDLLTNSLREYLGDPKWNPGLLEAIIKRSRRNQAAAPYGFVQVAPLDRTRFRSQNLNNSNWLNKDR